ncbi:hypothetical protein BZ163_23775 [Pseudomonas sp. VI4.1]|jgi:hypothetical protein|nr:hypothetical protein BZ163_23775 [Pseudomonas sp. VI4.1]
MIKPTPNPPDTEPVSLSGSTDSETRTPSKIFLIAPGIDNQTLLGYACETLQEETLQVTHST